MDRPRKRQKVSLACQRCRQRKLGCDQQRPCQLCVRAGAPCIPRGELNFRQPRTAETVETADSGETHEDLLRPNHEDTAMSPELNIVDLSTQMFSRRSQDYELGYDTSALPGGKKRADSSAPGPTPWREAVGVPMPPNDVLDQLITQFFDCVDWFMMVFHEGEFRRQYKNLIASVHVSASDDNNNFLWLVLLVLGLGAHYSSFTGSLGERQQNLQDLSKRLLTEIEYKFLRIIGSPNVEAVQICVLMGSFHLFNGRPTVGLGVLGSGIKIAQVIGLYRESMWQGVSDIAQETRRRSWWALEVADKYAAIAFGRPCTIDDSDCIVGLVRDIRANHELSPRQGPLLEYHRWKFKLYRIMGPFLGRRLQTNRLEAVKGIHSQLVSWEGQLPNNLRLEACEDDDTSEQPRLLKMQALALQLTYDNLQIILHRTIAFRNSSNEVDPLGVGIQAQDLYFSRHQLLKSALRTSQLHTYRQLLQACRKTHAVMHIGICLFTSGVVLCAVALSEPLSAASQEAKAGIMRILHLHRDSVSNQHLLSVQSVKILEDLVAVVMQSEQRIIIGCHSLSISSTERPTADENTTSAAPQRDSTVSHQAWSDQGSITPHASAIKGFLNPLQEVFAHHTQSQNPNTGVSDITTTENSMGQDPLGLEQRLPILESSAGFSWDGNISSLIDSGLADASQLWLWSDNLGYQSYTEPWDMFLPGRSLQ